MKSQSCLSWFPYRASVVLAALATANGVAAQNALVLSGGGARGLAHVGVVFELEQRGYDADLVVGNSMGAVVGALYAAGYEPDAIRQRVQSVRWSELFDPTPIVLGPDRELRVPAFNVDLDIARLRFSRGLLGSWRVNRTLARLLFDANARSRGDFDRLARRYRAIATDLQTGEEVVLDSGDLARAVRASMAYPGFFAPVLWGERVLIDGGIVDNFPVGVARALGAAHVIGVDVSRPTPEIESQAPFAVIQRAVNLMQRNPQPDSAAVDALVLPETYSASVGPGFPDDVRPLIELGRTAAQRDLPAVLPSGGPGRRTLPSAPVSFSTLELEAADSALAALARRVFADVIGKPYDPELVLAATDRLFATGLFEGVWPRAASLADTTGRPALLVRLEAPPTVSLSLAAQYDNDRSGRGWATLDKYGRIGQLPVTYSAAVSVGGLDQWAALSVRLHPPIASLLAWSLGTHAQERDVRVFEADTRSARQVRRAGGWLALDFPHILRQRMFALVARGEWIDHEAGRDGTAFGPLLRFSALLPEARVIGVPWLIEAERRWGEITYTRAALTGGITVGTRAELALFADLRAVSSAAPEDVRPALGDEHAIPGLRWGQQRGRARLIMGADAAHPVGGGFLRIRARTGTITDELADWKRTRWTTGAQLGLVWPTPLGLLEAGYGHATIGDGRFDISIGRSF